MKHSIQALLLSLSLTAVIGGTEWLFLQGTFFGRSVNLITQLCLLFLLLCVWYWFVRDLLDRRRHSSLPNTNSDSQPEPDAPPKKEPPEQLPASQPKADPEPVSEPIAVHGTGGTVFMPENAEGAQWVKAPESSEKPAKEEQNAPETAAPETAGEQQPESVSPPSPPLTAVEKAKLKTQMQQERAEEKARKLSEAAAQKQAQRARKLEEETARQKQKLEDLKAEAARKKAAAPAKRTYWNKDND